MKKIIFLLSSIILLSIVSCKTQSSNQQSIINRESKDKNGTMILLGSCTRTRLEQEPFGTWFNKNYADYKVDTVTAEKIKPYLTGKRFVIFMGSWCGDSKREVPRMFKLLDYCGIDSSRIQLILLNNADSVYKQSPGHEEKDLNIHRVPDLLVYTNKIENGRIVESPVSSLENDLLQIASDQPYQPHYRGVSFLVNQFNTHTITEMTVGLPVLTNQLQPLVMNRYELNTYGYVLLAAKKLQEAGIVFQLNTELYPEDANAFSSLAEFYLKTEHKTLAKAACTRALLLDPGNEDIKKMWQAAQ